VNDSGRFLMFRILLDESYSSDYGRFTLKDMSGKKWEISTNIFLAKIGEITNQNYKIYGIYGTQYIYRQATKDEINAYEKNLKQGFYYNAF
jgi:hypothetical protein